jgi:hypothetical protein
MIKHCFDYTRNNKHKSNSSTNVKTSSQGNSGESGKIKEVFKLSAPNHLPNNLLKYSTTVLNHPVQL